MSVLAAILLAQAAAAIPAETPPPMPTGDELVSRIEANDARLFWGFFEG